jgi:hypothetical protein
VFAELVDLHDARMLQSRHGLGLGLETGEFLRAGVSTGQDHLQGDEAGEFCLARLVNDTRVAPASKIELYPA